MHPLLIIVLWVVTVLTGWLAIVMAHRAHGQLDHDTVKNAKTLLKRAWALTGCCLVAVTYMFFNGLTQLHPPAYTGLTLSILALLMISQAHRRLVGT